MCDGCAGQRTSAILLKILAVIAMTQVELRIQFLPVRTLRLHSRARSAFASLTPIHQSGPAFPVAPEVLAKTRSVFRRFVTRRKNLISRRKTNFRRMHTLQNGEFAGARPPD